MIPEKLNKPYNPAETEDRIYKLWEDQGYFEPENGRRDTGRSFSMALPPPNVTGTLHMGHSAMLAVQDILTRYHRMQGDETLWLPGTDHAAIATQSVVEKKLYKEEKKTRHDLGREEFMKRVNKFARESHDTIVNQVRKMGASVDWSREAFTLDEARNLAVRTAFKRMFDAGLIYRGNRIVNWDVKLQTTVSDDEIEYEERKGKLYTFRYAKDFPIPISTTRPETKLGDTAVAVHPEDARYRKHVGKTFNVSFCGAELSIKVVADEAVDPQFGTGAVGVTPAHSFTDFDIAARHELPVVQVISEYGKMTVGIEGVREKKAAIARDAVAEWIRGEGLMEREEEITHAVALGDRSNAVIEPLPKRQWFVDVNKEFILHASNISGVPAGSTTTLKQILKRAVESGQIEILPERFNKIYFQWIDNLRDWCISRQIWYGHRIPVWYRSQPGSETEVHCDTKPPSANWESEGWEQDPDTLDTWFSSGLWTFSTLGWPSEDARGRSVFLKDGSVNPESDFGAFHPTSVLETAPDIIFFWVARMILMTGFLLGDIPFRYVYFHGLVRDAQGRKMSKSLGNTIDPLELIGKYGADATRLSLIVGAPPGNDISLSEGKVRGYKHFANKIWNAARFVLMSTEDADVHKMPNLAEADKRIIAELDALVGEVTDDIENFRLYLAGEKLYHYFWHTFADKIIEEAKVRMRDGDADERRSVQWTLFAILKTNLALLHPFMPFVTEELWQIIHGEDRPLILEPWPQTYGTK